MPFIFSDKWHLTPIGEQHEINFANHFRRDIYCLCDSGVGSSLF